MATLSAVRLQQKIPDKEAKTRLCRNIHQCSIAFRSDLSHCRFNNRISVLIFSVLKQKIIVNISALVKTLRDINKAARLKKKVFQWFLSLFWNTRSRWI